MNHFEKDINNDEILLSSTQEQVMMEWEKPYMEASIDFLEPKGHVLEVGFGCGYSASQIMKYKPKSYTVIECDPIVIEKANIWREKYPDVKIFNPSKKLLPLINIAKQKTVKNMLNM